MNMSPVLPTFLNSSLIIGQSSLALHNSGLQVVFGLKKVVVVVVCMTEVVDVVLMFKVVVVEEAHVVEG